MLTCEWTAEHGWLDPKITPYQNLSLDPATCVFHYAFECFEGMKAYKVRVTTSLTGREAGAETVNRIARDRSVFSAPR